MRDPAETTPLHGTLTPDQAAYDARQDARLRALRRWITVAVTILSVGVIAADAIATASLLRGRVPAAAAPAERVFVVTVEPPAAAAFPPCPACPACPAYPPPPEHHRR